MPDNEVDAIKEDLVDLKKEVRDSLSGMRSDLKELAKALHELIRLDGDLGRVADLANRIGREVDELAKLWRTEKEALNTRVGAIEIQMAGNSKSVGLFDGVVKHSLVAVLSGGVGATLMKVFG